MIFRKLTLSWQFLKGNPRLLNTKITLARQASEIKKGLLCSQLYKMLYFYKGAYLENSTSLFFPPQLNIVFTKMVEFFFFFFFYSKSI